MFNEKTFLKTNNKNNGNKIFIIAYVIFIIVLIYVTALAVSIKIDALKKEKANTPYAFEENDKTQKTAGDLKFAIASYDETYDINPIKFVYNYDIDGNISTNDAPDSNHTYRIQFLQIEGLKNKDIQYSINEKLKQKAYALGFNDNNVNCMVTANYSNILSVLLYSGSQIDTLNVDLSTGNEIHLSDVFVSSTTLNSYLENAFYKTLLWSNISTQSQQIVDNILDISKIDTSSYEDKLIQLINNYSNNADTTKFNITENSVNVYGLINKDMINVDNVENYSLNINLIDCANEVAIYKRYLKNSNIYENTSLGLNNTIVFTKSIASEPNTQRINYGKIEDNIFIEENLYEPDEKPENIDTSVVTTYIKNISEDLRNNLKNQTSNNKGTFYQRAYNHNYDAENSFFVIKSTSYQAMSSISYFKTDAFLDYIKLKSTGATGLIGFDDSVKSRFTNLEILPTVNEEYYISTSGDFLGKTLDEAKTKQAEIKAQQQLAEQLQNTQKENERLQQLLNETQQTNNTVDTPSPTQVQESPANTVHETPAYTTNVTKNTTPTENTSATNTSLNLTTNTTNN